MDFTYLPSLQHMTLFKVAFILWNKYSVYYNTLIYWNPSENEVIEIIENLPLKTLTRERLKTFYKAIHNEIKLWTDFNITIIPDQYASMCICDMIWTSVGTIDKRKTAEKLVRNENLPITVRYELACIYCLEDDVKYLYHLLPKEYYKHFFSENIEYQIFDTEIYQYNKLIVAWTYSMTYDDNSFIKNNISLFNYSIFHANKLAAEFLFFGTNINMTLDLIDAIWFNGIENYSYHIEIILFLLEQMDNDELTFLLHLEDTYVLCTLIFCLKHWPWHYCFKETYDCTCGVYCKESNWLTLLNLFYRPRDENNRTIFLWTLFFFRNAFPEKISYLIRNCDHENLLLQIFKDNDTRSLKLALKYLPEVKKIDFYKTCCHGFWKYFSDVNDFSMLEAMYKECAVLDTPVWKMQEIKQS